MREFLHVDDLADLCLFLMERYDEAGHINAGTGEDITIRRLAETIRNIVHPSAGLTFDASKPDGTPRKVLDVSRIRAMGWAPKIDFETGVRDTYEWFLAQDIGDLRGVEAEAVSA
jgi:GDP-L-fucose synthase